MLAGYLTDEDFRAIPADEVCRVAGAAAPPLASVLVLAYQHAAYIEQALRSVLTQACAFEWEVLVGDDASTDGALEICRRLHDEFPSRLRVLTAERNVGMHRNFARLWFHARGRYVAVCEGDDYWTDIRKLQKQVAYLEERPAYTLCGALTGRLEPAASGAWMSAGTIGPARAKDAYTVEDLIPDYTFHTSSVVIRKSAVRFPDWFWSVYCVDRPLYLLCAESGPVGHIPECMSVYRMHGRGAWAPRDALGKARAGAELFARIDAHFGGRHRRLIRRTVAAIVWSYIGDCLRSGDRRTGRRLFAMAVRYGFPRLPVSPWLAAKVAARLCVPAFAPGVGQRS